MRPTIIYEVVRIVRPDSRSNKRGAIIQLLTLEPLPRYLVALETGARVELSELALKRVG